MLLAPITSVPVRALYPLTALQVRQSIEFAEKLSEEVGMLLDPELGWTEADPVYNHLTEFRALQINPGRYNGKRLYGLHSVFWGIDEMLPRISDPFMQDCLRLTQHCALVLLKGFETEWPPIATLRRFRRGNSRTGEGLPETRSLYAWEWSPARDPNLTWGLRSFFGYGLRDLIGIQDWKKIHERWDRDQHSLHVEHQPHEIGFGVHGALLLHLGQREPAKPYGMRAFEHGFVPFPEEYFERSRDSLGIHTSPQDN